VGGLQNNGLLQLPLPFLIPLVWKVSDQIQAPALQSTSLQTLLEPMAGLKQILSAMSAPQGREPDIVKTLPSQTHAGHARINQGVQIPALKGGWIHLKGDFSTVLEAEAASELLQQRCKLIGPQQGWRTTADIHGGQWRRWGREVDLCCELRQVGLDRTATRPSIRISPIPEGHHREVAIKTTPMAKRNM
jgi:hypothetical protein